MIKNMFLGVCGSVFFGAMSFNPVYGSDEARDLFPKTNLRQNTHDTRMFFDPLAFQAMRAMQYTPLFIKAVEEGDFLSAVGCYEKALECCPQFPWGYEMETVSIYLRLEDTPKAQALCDRAMSKITNPTLDELRVAREVAMRCENVEKISEFNRKIKSIIGRDFIIEDIVSFFYESFKKQDEVEAYKMWKMLVSHKECKDYFSDHTAKLGFELCVFHKDYKGVSQILDLVEDKKSFFGSNEKYICFAYEAYVMLAQYKKLFDTMKSFGGKNSLEELVLLASLSELQGDYQSALSCLERIVALSPDRSSYEMLVAFCQRAQKEVLTGKQKKIYADKANGYKVLLSQSGQAEVNDEAKKKPTSQSVGRAVCNLIAHKYMTSAHTLWEQMPQDEYPELKVLQEEMGACYKACAVSLEGIKAQDSSSTVSEMRGKIERMEKILKLLKIEKEKVLLANRRLHMQGNFSAERSVLPSGTSINLRKEVLEEHGLPQKREKPSNTNETELSFAKATLVEPEEDTPYAIEWVWTNKSQKEKEGLSSDAQAKLGLFMEEVTMNPWSVRRDGSLASGEPRHIVGYGPNSYERDMDAYNRFIYSVIATGPKSAKVVVLGVQGHL